MKYFGCNYLEHGLSFERNRVDDCCIIHHDKLGMPNLIENYNGEPIDWEHIFKLKREKIERQKKSILKECEGCCYLYEKEDTEEKYISELAFSAIKLCNAKCIYCGDGNRFHKKYYDVYPAMVDLVEKGYFKVTDSGLVVFVGGEPTIMKHFDDLTDLFIKQNANIKVYTSAIRFSQILSNGIERGNIQTCISLDCGCKETYKKIKNVDKFDILTNTIEKYVKSANKSSNSKIMMKYLITPGYNDTVEEIDLFFDKMKELNVKDIVFDVEATYTAKNIQKDISPHVLYLLDYAKSKAEKENFIYQIFSYAYYVEQERQIPYSEELISDKKTLIKTVNRLRAENAYKNIQYATPAQFFVD